MPVDFFLLPLVGSLIIGSDGPQSCADENSFALWQRPQHRVHLRLVFMAKIVSISSHVLHASCQPGCCMVLSIWTFLLLYHNHLPAALSCPVSGPLSCPVYWPLSCPVSFMTLSCIWAGVLSCICHYPFLERVYYPVLYLGHCPVLYLGQYPVLYLVQYPVLYLAQYPVLFWTIVLSCIWAIILSCIWAIFMSWSWSFPVSWQLSCPVSGSLSYIPKPPVCMHLLQGYFPAAVVLSCIWLDHCPGPVTGPGLATLLENSVHNCTVSKISIERITS